MQIIPLTSAPNQTLTVSLSVDGGVLTLQLAVNFNEIAEYWVMAVSDRAGNLLLSSIPLICGGWPAANLLAQFGYLAIGSAYVINVSNATADWPGITGLGTDFLLLWDDTAA